MKIIVKHENPPPPPVMRITGVTLELTKNEFEDLVNLARTVKKNSGDSGPFFFPGTNYFTGSTHDRRGLILSICATGDLHKVEFTE